MTAEEAIQKQRKAMEMTMSHIIQLLQVEPDKLKKEFLSGYYQGFYDIYLALESILNKEEKKSNIIL